MSTSYVKTSFRRRKTATRKDGNAIGTKTTKYEFSTSVYSDGGTVSGFGNITMNNGKPTVSKGKVTNSKNYKYSYYNRNSVSFKYR